MKIDYITAHDPTNIRTWSGLNYFIRKTLIEAGAELNIITDLHAKPDWGLKWRYHFYRKLGKNYQYERTDCYTKQFGEEVNRQLSKDADFILSTTSAALPYINTRKSLILYTDATFDNLAEYYTHFSRLPASSKRMADRLEAKSFNKCAALIFSSQWAARSAIDYYKINPSKVFVIPFGANLKNIPSTEDVNNWIDGKTLDEIKFLWAGVEFKRKGGPLALEVVRQIREKSIDAKITFLGIDEKESGLLPEFATAAGFLDKGNPSQADQVAKLFSEAHFFILPTSMDCSPVVLPEAAAYGLPSLTSNISGIPTIVEHAETGFIFSPAAEAGEYVKKILPLLTDPPLYRTMAKQARHRFDHVLNWKQSCETILRVAEQLAID